MTAEEIEKLNRLIESPNKELVAGVLFEMALASPTIEHAYRTAAFAAGVIERFDYLQRCHAQHMADKLVGYDDWLDLDYPMQDHSESNS